MKHLCKLGILLVLSVCLVFALLGCNETTETDLNGEDNPSTPTNGETIPNVDNTTSPENATDTPSILDKTEDAVPVFSTKDIVKITFEIYYGRREVPPEHVAEITAWLGTFTIDEEAPMLPPPGTNTYHVEIEYADGTVINEGLDVIEVDGIAYSIKRPPEPECFSEIMSKASLE